MKYLLLVISGIGVFATEKDRVPTIGLLDRLGRGSLEK